MNELAAMLAVLAATLPLCGCFWQPPYTVRMHHSEHWSSLDVGDDAMQSDLNIDLGDLEMVGDEQMCGLSADETELRMRTLHEHLSPAAAAPAEPGALDERLVTDYGDLGDRHQKRGLDARRRASMTRVGRLVVGGNVSATSSNDTLSKREALNGTQGQTLNSSQAREAAEYEYDYNALRQEYDAGLKIEALQAAGQTKLNFTQPEETHARKGTLHVPLGGKGGSEEGRKWAWPGWLSWRPRDYLVAGLVLYVVVAVPCYCRKGWCCCCFMWVALCRPRNIIRDAKRYASQNPPGVLRDELPLPGADEDIEADEDQEGVEAKGTDAEEEEEARAEISDGAAGEGEDSASAGSAEGATTKGQSKKGASAKGQSAGKHRATPGEREAYDALTRALRRL